MPNTDDTITPSLMPDFEYRARVFIESINTLSRVMRVHLTPSEWWSAADGVGVIKIDGPFYASDYVELDETVEVLP
jgi:hypothetical protein